MRSFFRALVLFAGLSLSLCSAQVLVGAGATFPYPVYSRWFHDFRDAFPGMSVNYQSVGSGAGIVQLSAGVIDFGASDMPLTDEQNSAMKNPVLHFPTVMGGVVPIYNLDDRRLQFTPEILAGIFLGELTRWNDPRIRRANPGVDLPDQPIIAVHRSDASGTTFVFTDYLSKAAPAWQARVGRGTSVNWPGGEGEKGSEGVATRTRRTPGSIGYVELAYALQNGLAYGSVRNSAGVFVRADMKSVSAAAARTEIPGDFRVSITDAPGADAYPISTFSWLLVPETTVEPVKKKALITLLRWTLTRGQSECATLGYAPLPHAVIEKELRQLTSIH